MRTGRQIQKNVDRYVLNEICKNMTPEQYKANIERAISVAAEDLRKYYQIKLDKMQEECNQNIKYSITNAIDTIAVELLYELASQLGCFEENPEYLEDKIYRVQEIYDNTMKSIARYTKYKNDKQARKEFEKRKKKVEKMFNIKI